jgi:hypothetical protein
MHIHKEGLHEYKHSFQVSFPEKSKLGQYAYEKGYRTELDENKQTNKLRGLSLQANYTYRATATCWLS